MSDEKRKTILLVEDEILVSRLEEGILEKYGFIVKTAKTGADAVEAMDENTDIDLILMDINLGDGMDGTHAAEIILKRHDLPIIFISSHTEREIVEKTENISSYGYIVKNTGETVMIASIKMAFRLFESRVKEKESEAFRKMVFESSIVPVVIMDGETNKYIDCNLAALSIYRFSSREELLGKTPIDVSATVQYDGTPSEEKAVFYMKKAIEEGRIVFEWLHRRPDGELWDADVQLMSFFSKGRRFLQFSLIDITERKRAVEALRKREESYHSFVTNSHDAIYCTEFDNPIDTALPVEKQIDEIYKNAYLGECNQTMVDMYRLPSVEAFKGKRLIEFHGGSDNPVNRETFRKFIESGYKSINCETSEVLTTGEKKYFMSNDIGIVENGMLLRIWGSAVDITERKKSEEALRESEERFRNIFEKSTAGYVLASEDGRLIKVNKAMADITGYSIEELQEMNFMDITHPEDRVLTSDVVLKIIEGMEEYGKFEKRYVKKDGKIVWVLVNTVFIKKDKTSSPYFITSITDITERKMAESVIIENERKYRLLFENMEEGFSLHEIITDEKDKAVDFRFIDVNAAYEKHTGLSRDKVIGRTILEIMPNADRKQIESYARVAMTGTPLDFEYHSKTFDRFIRVRAFRPSPGRFATVFEDITNTKRTGDIIYDYTARLEMAMSAADMAWWEMDVITGNVIFNKRKAEMIGRSPEEFKHYKDFMALIHPDDYDKTMKAMTDHFDGVLERYETEYRILSKSGEYKWYHDIGTVVKRNESGAPLKVVGLVLDISSRKKADEAIRLFKSILDTSNEACAVSDSSGQFVYINKAHENLFGRTFEEARNMNYRDYYPPESIEVLNNEVVPRLMRGESWEGELDVFDSKGRRFPLWERADSIRDAKGNYLFGFGFMHDISEQKNAELKIRILLEEKEVLLREVHHRIKNNMNTICNLLSLQADSMTDPLAIDALNDARIRVESMRVLYEKLYSYDEITEIPIKDYLSSLVDEVIANFPESRTIKTEKDVGDFILEVKKVQPLGLIVNELLTNIMKYAFKGKEGGTVSIKAWIAGDVVTVQITDDGVGIPESVNFENSTGFGLFLVRLLTKQLNGSIDIVRGTGTSFVLKFDL